VRGISFESAIFSDRNHVNFAVLTFSRAIVTSRKRKLRQLFLVATEADGLPSVDISNPDAPPATPAEILFLQGCDILQYVLPVLSTPFRDGRVASGERVAVAEC
jgi:hypothetical protein